MNKDMLVKKKINKLYLTILLLAAVLLFPASADAESTTFCLAPPSTTAGQVSGANEVAPRGFSIDLNGPEEEGGIYWLQSEYDNYNWNPVYTGVTNGYDEPLPVADSSGNAITYDFYAWIDRNPAALTDAESGTPFIALYRDGEIVTPFPGKLDAPSREDGIRDPSGTEMDSSQWSNRWKVHFTLQLESGHDYSLVFLRGITGNNGVTAVVNEEDTGYLKGTLTASEQEWYDQHKFDEYQYREYRYVTYSPSSLPQSKVIDTSVENEYEGIYRPMRFRFTTKLNESLYQIIADAEELYKNAEAGTEAGQYPQEAIDKLGSAIEQAKTISDDASDDVKEAAAAELKKAVDDFEAQCTVEVQDVSIYHNETDFYVGQTGTAKATVTVVPDKAAYKKVTWSSSDNITINENTGQWQIDYGGPCSITAVSRNDSTVTDTWNFEVPLEDGSIDVNVSTQTQEGDSVTALQAIVEKASEGNTDGITSLKVSTASGISLTEADIQYIKKAFPNLENLDMSGADAPVIPDGAFSGMSALKSVELPETVAKIGPSAFSGCTALSSLELPSSTAELGSNVFENCSSLGPDFYCHAPQAPASEQNAAELFGDTKIETIHVPYGCSEGYAKWAESYKIETEAEKVLTVAVSSPGGLQKAAELALDGKSDRDIDTLVITGGIKLNDTDMAYLGGHFLRATTIDLSKTSLDKCRAQSFINRTALKKIVLPETVGTIGDKAFYGCRNLAEIILPAGLDKIGNLAFGGCEKLPEQLIIEAEEPPELSDTAFDKTVVKSFLVPGQSVEKYKEAYVWKDFDIESQVEVSLDKTSLSVEEGGKASLTAKVSLKYGTDDAVSWKSSDEDVVQVNYEGQITGRKAGEADVIVTTNQGGLQAVCHVTVKKAAAPQVAAKSSSYSQIKVSWSKVTGAESYEVWRASSRNGSYVKLNTLTSDTLSYYDGGLTTGKTYYYKVRIRKIIDEIPYSGEYSDAVSAAPVPGTPSVTAARYSYNGCKVTWSAVSGASGYQIYRSTSKTGTYKPVKTAPSGARSYINTGLTTGKTYYYKVRAYRTVNNEPVCGAFSSVKSAKPALSTPGGLTVGKYSSGYVKVKWKGISGESGYQVYRATSKNGKYTRVKSVTMTSSSYPYAKIKATKGKTYYYKVRAYKKVGSAYAYSSFSTVKSYKLK